MTRLWAMTKRGPGDWTLLSDGQGTLYRFTRYEDGHHLGLMDGPEFVTRWWVRAIDADYLLDQLVDGVEFDGAGWHDLATCPTRREAIAYAERHMTEHPEGVPA